MPSWLIKSAIHHAIAWLPQRQRWNAIFQKYGTKSLTLGSGMFEMRVVQCRQHLDAFFELRPGKERDFSVVELGTGWFPTLALGMHLCGAAKIWTFEIDPLLNASRLSVLVNYFCDYHERGDLVKLLPRLVPERIQRLQKMRASVASSDPVEFLRGLEVHFQVRDAQNTGLPSGVADFIFSHGVLEYIPRPVLAGMLREFKRVAKPGAVMNHYIDLADQYHYFDRNITPFNFLQYPAVKWKRLDSPLMPQNRFRVSDYRALLAETGWELVRESNTPGSEQDLQRITLAPEFAGRDKNDLLVIKSSLLSRLPAGA